MLAGTPITTTVTIVDDNYYGKLQFSAPSYNVNEEGGHITIPVVRLGGSSETLSVNYSTTDGSATAGTDYLPTNGAVVFNPGEMTKTIAVTVLGDMLNEATEFLGVVLGNPVNVTLGESQGIGVITDDDLFPTLSIADASVLEGNGGTNNILFTVTLNPVSGQRAFGGGRRRNSDSLSGIELHGCA